MSKVVMTSSPINYIDLNKLCNVLADSVLNAYLKNDQNSIVNCEVKIFEKKIIVWGYVYTKQRVDIKEVINNLLIKLENIIPQLKIFTNDISIIDEIKVISSNYLYNKNELFEENNIYVVGYACNENADYMYSPLVFSKKLIKRFIKNIKDTKIEYAIFDIYFQIYVEYRNEKVFKINKINCNIMTMSNIKIEEIKKLIIEKVIKSEFSNNLLDDNTDIFINTQEVIRDKKEYIGLSNKSVMLNDYSNDLNYGKDFKNIKRAATYLTRYISKNLVATGLVEKVEIGLYYKKVDEKPVTITVNSFGKQFDSGMIDSEDIIQMIKDLFPLSIKEIIKYFGLEKSKYGCIDNDCIYDFDNCAWEMVDAVKKIQNYFTKKKGLIFLKV